MEPIKILVVEDEPITARDLNQSLKALGYVVSGTVDSAEDAMEEVSGSISIWHQRRIYTSCSPFPFLGRGTGG
jgi:hypothetical protein